MSISKLCDELVSENLDLKARIAELEAKNKSNAETFDKLSDRYRQRAEKAEAEVAELERREKGWRWIADRARDLTIRPRMDLTPGGNLDNPIVVICGTMFFGEFKDYAHAWEGLLLRAIARAEAEEAAP